MRSHRDEFAQHFLGFVFAPSDSQRLRERRAIEGRGVRGTGDLLQEFDRLLASPHRRVAPAQDLFTCASCCLSFARRAGPAPSPEDFRESGRLLLK